MSQVPRRIVFWTDILSHHQVPWTQELASRHGIQVEHAVMRDFNSSERVAQGWPAIDTSGITVHVAPDSNQVVDSIGQDQSNSLHVITGGFSWATPRAALQECLKTGAKFGIMAEPPFPYARFYGLKRLAQRLFRAGRGQSVTGVWAIGTLATDFYRNIGYSSNQVVNWGYFPPLPSSLPELEPREVPRVTYVGQFNSRKGTDVLLNAVRHLNDVPFTLRLIGGGDDDIVVRSTAASFAPGRVVVEPFKPHAEAMQALAQSDLVVVPSRHDGWGAVVNEALSYGVPVVCTDRCGAQSLLSDASRGKIAKADDPANLAECMRVCLAGLPGTRESRFAWAQEKISPASASDYFVSSLKCLFDGNAKTPAPWE